MLKRRKLPVARDEGLLVEQVADETVVYDSESKAAHCLSPLAAVVFGHCDGRTTVDELAALSTERLGEPVDAPRVMDALAQLEERELLAVSPQLAVSPPDGDGLSRRQMIGKTAVAAGGFYAGTSLITSIVAPAAAANASATCADVTCCPCCTDSQLDIAECCTTPLTTQCQCVNASQGQRPGRCGSIVMQGKFCKTTAVGAPSDAQCLGLTTPPYAQAKPPATWCTSCYPLQATKNGGCGSCLRTGDPTCPDCP